MIDHTDITVILDESGSMDITLNDTINGFNGFLKSQKEFKGTPATFTLVRFNRDYKPGKATPITEAEELSTANYIPSGSTALYDAIVRTIKNTGQRLRDIPESERPDKVLIVIITDGEENASVEFGSDAVKNEIKHQEKVYNWEFLFIGANQDAIIEARKIGIDSGTTLTYTQNSIGTNSMYDTLSRITADVRTGVTAQILAEDREVQENAVKTS